VHDHRTGRKCASCGGVLVDTIVNFGDFLPAEPLERAREHAKKTDLCLVLGSSLTVPPASDIPDDPGRRKGAKLVICNLQSTPSDTLADTRIWTKSDDLMIRVMEKLKIPLPTFILHRRLTVECENKDGRSKLTVCGVDEDGTPATFLQSVKLEYNRRLVKTEPFVVNFRGDPGTELKIVLEFMGHYGEPNLEISHQYNGARYTRMLYLLDYNPEIGQWKTCKQDTPAVIDLEPEVIDLTDDTTILSNAMFDVAA
jgi:hypothetical protein